MTTFIPRPRTVAIRHDSPLRYLVPSSRNPEDKYMVELDAYKANGRCVCDHFQIRCEPLIKLGVTPQQAIDQDKVDEICQRAGVKPLQAIKLKVNRHVEDSLRCEHLMTGRSQFCDGVIGAIVEDRTQGEHRQERFNR